MYFKGSHVKFLKYDYVFLSLKVVLILPNSADTDEMQHYAAFCLGLHCLSKYLFRGFQYTSLINTLVNVYIDLVLFTRIAGTS